LAQGATIPPDYQPDKLDEDGNWEALFGGFDFGKDASPSLTPTRLPGGTDGGGRTGD